MDLKWFMQALNRGRGFKLLSGVAGIYHFINSVYVFLSSRNENFLEGRCVNENVCSNSPSIFTISLSAVRGLLFFRSFFLKTLKTNVGNLDSVLPLVFTNQKKIPCNTNKKQKVAGFSQLAAKVLRNSQWATVPSLFSQMHNNSRVAHLRYHAHLRRFVYLFDLFTCCPWQQCCQGQQKVKPLSRHVIVTL